MWGLGALIGGMAGYTVYHDAWGIGALAGAALGWLIGWRASCRLTEIERRLDVWDARLAALERLARQGEAEPETLPSAPLAAEPLQLLPPHAEASTPPRAGASAPPPAAPRPISPPKGLEDLPGWRWLVGGDTGARVMRWPCAGRWDRRPLSRDLAAFRLYGLVPPAAAFALLVAVAALSAMIAGEGGSARRRNRQWAARTGRGPGPAPPGVRRARRRAV